MDICPQRCPPFEVLTSQVGWCMMWTLSPALATAAARACKLLDQTIVGSLDRTQPALFSPSVSKRIVPALRVLYFSLDYLDFDSGAI